jgi:hypothetical protein
MDFKTTPKYLSIFLSVAVSYIIGMYAVAVYMFIFFDKVVSVCKSTKLKENNKRKADTAVIDGIE